MSYIQVPADEADLVEGDRMIRISNGFDEDWRRIVFKFVRYCECGCGDLKIRNMKTDEIDIYDPYDWEVRRYRGTSSRKFKRKKQRTFLARNPKNKPGLRTGTL